MLLSILALAAGAVMLYFGAEWLVRGSSGLARALGIPAFAIGLTVVAYGTSAPELIVGILAAWEDRGAIALGNAVGSNIANFGLILGATALIRPTQVQGGLLRREIPALLLTTAAVPALLFDGVIGRLEGSILVVGAIAWTWLSLRSGRSAQIVSDARAQERRSKPAVLVAIALGGLVVLLLGGKLLVDGASSIARAFGWSERIIGLTIVAVGTSLPELATSLIAAFRKESALAVGNVVGSNLFNVMMVLGATAVVRPIRSSLRDGAVDLVVLVVMTLAASVMMRTERRIGRLEGGLLAAGYVAFLVALAVLPAAP